MRILKTNITKTLLWLLVAALMLGAVMMVSVRAATPFPDVPSGKWFTDAVQYCYDKGYVSGYDDGTFWPNKKLTRAEMAVIMNKMLGLKDSAKNTFSDVAPDTWYTDPVLHCVKAGVMSGYDAKTFGTKDTLTREQGAVILAKAFNVAKADGRTTFADDKDIAGWAVGSVKAMNAKGLVSGMGNNMFQPKTPLTRAQMCQIIYAAQKKSGGDTLTSSPKPTTSTKPTATPTSSPKPTTSTKPTATPTPSASPAPVVIPTPAEACSVPMTM